MTPLNTLQTDFQTFLLRGDERLLQRVTGTARVDARTRAGIYYEAYRLRLLEALDSNYPVLHAWVGGAEFERLGLAYLNVYPSRHFSIRYFGQHLPAYMAAEICRDRPYLGEMAALEWALSEAFDAADDSFVRIEEMAELPPEAWPGMRFRLHASVRRLDLLWNVPAIWTPLHALVEAGEEGEEPASKIPAPAAADVPQPWLIWRQALRTYFRSLSVAEAWAIDAAAQGSTFAEICEGLTEWIEPEQVSLHAAGLLKRWITDGLIGALESHQ